MAATTTASSSAGLTGRTAWARNLGAPVRDFLRTETGGAVVLLAAALAALVWANSPWKDTYGTVWGTELALRLGGHEFSATLHEWVNSGLMSLFFLVVGLEAKRELDLGELRERTRIEIPVLAAIGGMSLPVVVFLAFNAGGAGAHGWGVAISTDTALALGALAIAAPRNNTRLRVFLLSLAVIDDLLALLVIAVVYTEHISFSALAVAIGLFGVLALLRFAGSWRGPAAVLVGVGIWIALFESGIDPVVAGLAIGLVTSAYPPERGSLERATELTRSFREQPTPELATAAQRSLASAISANERLQYRLHPWTSFVIVPLFALANAGIELDGDLLRAALTSPVTLGTAVGLLLGKPLGILGAAWLGTRPRLGGARLAVTWPGLLGTGAVAGVGFTVSLLIAGLAFRGDTLAEAKVGVLASALLAPALAWLVFKGVARMPASVRVRQLANVAEDIIDLAEDIDPARDHVRGQMDAPVTLVEYGDFQCPYCGQAEPAIRDLLSQHGNELRYVWRHLPLADVHPNAQVAAEAAEAAGAQGAFWAMSDALFAHQDALAPMDLHRYADELGLDVGRFSEDLRSRRFAPRVREDVASADASGVSGTPTFFVNGRRHYGAYDLAGLTAAVKAARARAAAAPPAPSRA